MVCFAYGSRLVRSAWRAACDQHITNEFRPSCRTFPCRYEFSTSAGHRQSSQPIHVTQQLSPAVGQKQALPNELLQIISSQIKAHGPLPLSRYISLCLSHPTLGYYTRKERTSTTSDAIIGKQGDFITSPEISQVFGELLAIWYVTQWQAQGMPKHARIIELGPGKGTLMDDMLRTFRSLRIFGDAIRDVHLVETSSYMRQLQKDKLTHYSPRINIHWHNRIQDVPQTNEHTYTMVVAHEFFDALPIHVFEKRPEGWREVFVDLDVSPGTSIIVDSRQLSKHAPPKLRYVISKAETLASRLLLRRNREKLAKMSGGARIELSPEGYEIATYAARLVGDSGAGLVIDYGGERAFSNSFRAFKKHEIVDPLLEPGSADLTSNVNFSFLRDALTTPPLSALNVASLVSSTPTTTLLPSTETRGITAETVSHATSPGASAILAQVKQTPTMFVPPLQSQRSFLLSMGIQARVQRLLDTATSDERGTTIIKAAERLIDKTAKSSGMGKTFKVMSFVPQRQLSDAKEHEVFPFGAELD